MKILKEIKITNKKATFLYNIFKKYTSGIVLKGTEVKSIRLSQVSINEAFCYFKQNELYIKNMNIKEYSLGSVYNHKSTRERKLLLNKKELSYILNKVKEKGFTIIPIELFITENGFVKINIALASGKKVFDKRNTLKERDNKRDLDKIKKRLQNK